MATWAEASYNDLGLVVDVFSFQGYHYRFRFWVSGRKCSRKEQVLRARYQPLDWEDVPPPVRSKLWDVLREIEEAATAGQGDFEESYEDHLPRLRRPVPPARGGD